MPPAQARSEPPGYPSCETALHILLVEDELELAAWLMRALTESGFTVDHASDVGSAERALGANAYDAMLLDQRLPDGDGLTLLSEIRQRNDRTPIMILTAQGTVTDRVRGLRLGADDFLAKPFALSELEARLIALVRRSHGGTYPRLRCGSLSYDPDDKLFLLCGKPLSLSRREQAALDVLMQNSGRPVERPVLFDKVFSEGGDTGPEAIEVVVHRLRKKLGEAVRIVTVRGLGYMLEAADSEVA